MSIMELCIRGNHVRKNFIGLHFSVFFSFQLRLRWKTNLSSLISSSACCCFKYKRTKELQQLSLVLSPIMPKAEMPPPFSSSPAVRTRRKHTTHHISPILGTQKGPLRFPEIDGPTPPPFLFLFFFYAFLSLRNVDKWGSASLDSLYRVPTACTVLLGKALSLKPNRRRVQQVPQHHTTLGTYVCAAQFTTNKNKLTKRFSYTNLCFPSFRPLKIYSRSRCVFSLLIYWRGLFIPYP